MDKDKIHNLIKDLIEKTTVKVNKISITEEGPKNTWYAVEVNEPNLFLGHDGEALNALNHLVRRMVESEIEGDKEGPEFLIDINGFQKKRVDNIRSVAHMMGERARYFKSNIEIDPMSAFERRIVHEFFSNMTDLKTESTGFGPTRRVVIKYVGSTSI